MEDYHEFRKAHVAGIEAWRIRWSPKYVSMTYGGTAAAPASTSAEVEEASEFNPVVEFFKVLKKNY